MVRVFCRRPSELRDVNAALAVLAPAERTRMARFRQQPDQRRYLTAWSLVRQTLAELTGGNAAALTFDRSCELCGHAEHGKPRLVGSAWEFSLAHAADRVVLAVAQDRPVGIDIEPAHAAIDEIAHLVLHPQEPAVTGPELVRVWVRKEAVAKLTGHGLALPMASFAVVPPPPGMVLHDLPCDDGYVAALATFHDPDTPDVHISRSG
jgi:4'-phosphopantetheinyl transferase